MHPHVAIITGVGGQDGSYLAEFLLEKGYHVYGMIRRHSSMVVLDRLKEARKHSGLRLIYGDVTDFSSICNILREALEDAGDAPIEFYNLAAQSHVKVSFETPMYTAQADAVGVLNALEAIVKMGLAQRVRFYQASTSELYGDSPAPQSELTPFQPRSPYAAAKLFAYWTVRNYREAYGIFAVNGILFNHESERRGETFVSRKVTRAVAEYARWGSAPNVLHLGNLNALRDWGHANDYIRAMWVMLQHTVPEDFVIATGKSHTVKELVETAYDVIGVSIRWEGEGADEKGFNAETGALLVQVDPRYYRLTEVNHLCGDASKAREVLGWHPVVGFEELVKKMVHHDLVCLTEKMTEGLGM